MMKSINEVNVRGKKVVVRLDLDVPVEKGEVQDRTRLEAALPTLRYLLKKKATIIILGHAGRPDGEVVDELSLRPILACLMEMLGNQLTYEIIQRPMMPLDDTIFALENLRFTPDEENNDPEFARYLAGFGDMYVNDAFAVSHRAHASLAGITDYLPSYAGLHLVEEVKHLEAAMKQPSKPVVAILGGAKVETKLPVIESMAQFADAILLGGKLVLEADTVVLPEKVVMPSGMRDNFDIDEASARHFAELVTQANTIIWNGPLGKFEQPPYDEGTAIVAKAVAANTKAVRLIGGGDTIAALNDMGLLDQVGYVSSGGGAMLDFLAREPLPGLVALGYRLEV
jgi:phosphoglycerate kinase